MMDAIQAKASAQRALPLFLRPASRATPKMAVVGHLLVPPNPPGKHFITPHVSFFSFFLASLSSSQLILLPFSSPHLLSKKLFEIEKEKWTAIIEISVPLRFENNYILCLYSSSSIQSICRNWLVIFIYQIRLTELINLSKYLCLFFHQGFIKIIDSISLIKPMKCLHQSRLSYPMN